jgi:AraC-like DNA-binding protein
MQIMLQVAGALYHIEHITTNYIAKRKGVITVRHRHPVFHIIYITEGRGTFQINDHISHCEQGHLYIINPNEWHEFQGDPDHPFCDFECTFYIKDSGNEPSVLNLFDMVQLDRSVALPPLIAEQPLMVPLHLRPLLLQGFQRILDTAKSWIAPGHTSIMINDLLLLTAEIVMNCAGAEKYQPQNAKDQAIVEIKQYLQTHMDQIVSLADLVDIVHLTPTYICRTFKKESGFSPMDYLLHIRMTEAEKLLAHTDLPVYLIAEKVGFQEPSYFARVFKDKHDLSPTEYRKKIISYA